MPCMQLSGCIKSYQTARPKSATVVDLQLFSNVTNLPKMIGRSKFDFVLTLLKSWMKVLIKISQETLHKIKTVHSCVSVVWMG